MRDKSRIFITSLILYFCSSITMPGVLMAFNEGDLIVFRDNETRFSFHYPKTWKPVAATYKDTRFKMVSRKGKGAEDCGVNVKYENKLIEISPSYFSKNVAPQASKALLDQIRLKAPDARIIESGPTFISNREAYYYVIVNSFKTIDYEAKIANYSVQTIKNGYIYTISCRCNRETLNEMLPEFKKIMTGFILTD